MAAARTRHVGKLRAYVAKGRVVVRHLVHVDRRRHGEVLLCLREVEVAVEHPRDVRGIRDDGEDLSDVKVMERGRDILQGVSVTVVGIDLHTRAVLSGEFHVCTHALVCAEVDIVAVVDGKLLISEYRVVAIDMQADPFVLHDSHEVHAHAELALGVVDTRFDPRAMLCEGTVEEGMERQLTLLAVLQLYAVGHLFGCRREV